MEASLEPRGGVAHAAGSRWTRLLVALPLAVALLALIGFGTSSYLHSQLLALGQSTWDYYGIIRHELEAPSCDANVDIEAGVQRELQRARAQAADSLLPPAPPNPDGIRRSLEARRDQCRQAHIAYEYNREARASGLLTFYSAIEGGVGSFNELGMGLQRYLMVIVLLLCAWGATLSCGHISLRLPSTRLDYTVTTGFQLLGNMVLLLAAWRWLELMNATRDGAQWLHLLWVLGFAGLAITSLYQLVRTPAPQETVAGGSLAQALLTVPLFTYMALIAGTYFLFAESYVAGLAVQMVKLVGHADLYINVALYVWVGMMLKQSRLASLLFDVVRPWRLAPELIVIVVILGTAVPTAITGASGIFLIAVGAVVYNEIRQSGARRPLAFAATAMSGSKGIVLNPCLLVVIVAALNKQVTTTELFSWGGKVFLLTTAVFATVVLLTRRNALSWASPREAVPAMLRALPPLLPYLLIVAGVLLLFSQVLEQRFNEFSAPTILPVMLLLILAYDRWADRRERGADAGRGFWSAVGEATSESATHIGALLMLMALSVAIGGVVERAELMSLFPGSFESIWLAMLALVLVLVLIGMFMEPYGAVILVSATIASVAYQSGVHPVHFWMVVLVAFELGYLTPPVALNHLLTRQVVGEREWELAREAERAGASFWQRHERILMPILIMGVSLLLVAFVPLLFLA